MHIPCDMQRKQKRKKKRSI